MHSYRFENKIHFVIDDNSDNVSSFNMAEEFLRKKKGFVLKEYKPPFWFSGLMDFTLDNTNLILNYHDMGGTELVLSSEDVSEETKRYIQLLLEEILNKINGDNTA